MLLHNMMQTRHKNIVWVWECMSCVKNYVVADTIERMYWLCIGIEQLFSLHSVFLNFIKFLLVNLTKFLTFSPFLTGYFLFQSLYAHIFRVFHPKFDQNPQNIHEIWSTLIDFPRQKDASFYPDRILYFFCI